MAAAVEAKPKRWTYEEYYRLDDEKRYEIIDGELLMGLSPDSSHQDWAGGLNDIVRAFVLRHKLGKTFFAPLDLILDAQNTVQPDLIFISKAKATIIKQQRGIFGVPDLLVELVSPSSVRRDRYQKRELYARFGVPEYWIVDPANKALEVLTLREGHYELHCCAEEKGKVTSLVLPGLEFDVSELP